MITITQEIKHHERNFSIMAENWPEADGAANAIRWLRDWLEDHPPAATRVLHYVISARDTWAGAGLRLVELDEADAAADQARRAGLPAYYEEPPPGRFVRITADAEESDQP
jgi:hypothetical protein